ncbi:hypothetical protein [Heyndrickxia ginsengihumi]|nr:hypothetical protein [Heyndrickxia ginsengihumi]
MRKQIIVNEIKLWKENKMIPQEYCDFLLALYSEDIQDQESSENIRKSKSRVVSKDILPILGVYLLVVCLLSIAVFVIYFTEFPFILQTVILTVFVGFLLWACFYYSNKEFYFGIFLIGTALLLLLLTVQLNDHLFHHNRSILYIMLFIHCILWLIVGKKFKLLFFTLSGIVGIIIIIISIVI